LSTPLDIGVHQRNETTSNFDGQFNKQVRIFPNPVRSLVNVALEDKIVGDAKGYIYDTTGKVVYSFNEVIDQGSFCLNLNHLGIAPGHYALKLIVNGQEHYISKMIVQM